MANNSFSNNVEGLFKGLDGFFTSKTVIGEAVQYGETTVIPLMEVSFGMGAGAFEGKGNDSGGGGVGAKMSPSAVLILNNGTSKLISVKDTSGVAKVLDLVPDFVNKFMDNGSVEKEENLDDIFEDKKDEISEEKKEENKEENK